MKERKERNKGSEERMKRYNMRIVKKGNDKEMRSENR